MKMYPLPRTGGRPLPLRRSDGFLEALARKNLLVEEATHVGPRGTENNLQASKSQEDADEKFLWRPSVNRISMETRAEQPCVGGGVWPLKREIQGATGGWRLASRTDYLQRNLRNCAIV